MSNTAKVTSREWAYRLGICAWVCVGALAVGCAGDADDDGDDDKESMASGQSGDDSGMAEPDGEVAEGDGLSENATRYPVGTYEAKCGDNDTPETGLQGDIYPGPVNCGLTLLSEVPMGGSVQGSGHCAYLRLAGGAAYTGSVIKAFDLSDPFNPVETDEEPAVGGSESMRAATTDDRAILVSGRGVYDLSNCQDMVKKGEIAWPSMNAQIGNYMRALSSHEIAISHDAMRVYSGLGFNIAYLDDLDDPDNWTVKNWSCEMNKQSGFTVNVPDACDGPQHQDVGRQYSHSSDDNLEGTVWYGANQEGSPTQMEPATARMVDISDPDKITILDSVPQFPGHSMNWWRTPDRRDFIIGANEGLGPADSCVAYPRPTNLGNALDAYVVEVTGNRFGEPFPLTLDINKPENCQAAKASGSRAAVTEHSVYNKHGAAFVMLEFGSAGLRIFDLRDGDNPKEVAYYNDKKGYVHSGVFHYDDARGIILASGRQALQVLMLQPDMIKALGLPEPTDPDYPYVK